jgi:large subunit ribosomal protein L13
MMKTYSPKPDHIERRWYVLDASGQVLGRLATEVATLLRGKHKPIFAPHMDTGDHVIVINASKVEVTGDKRESKFAYHHSGYPGGLTETSYGRLLDERPDRAVEKAVRGMLPKNRLGRQMIKKLHVERGPDHRHQAQKPVSLGVGERPVWSGFPAPSAAPTPKRRRDTGGTGAESPGDHAVPDEPGSSATSTAAKKPARKRTAVKKTAAKRTGAVTKTAAAQQTSQKKTGKTTKSTAKKPATRTRATRKPKTSEE